MAQALKPILAKWDHERNSWIWGLTEEDFDRVQKGYACVRCLEGFDHFVAKCYVCGEPNAISVAELPKEWVGR